MDCWATKSLLDKIDRSISVLVRGVSDALEVYKMPSVFAEVLLAVHTYPLPVVPHLEATMYGARDDISSGYSRSVECDPF